MDPGLKNALSTVLPRQQGEDTPERFITAFRKIVTEKYPPIKGIRRHVENSEATMTQKVSEIENYTTRCTKNNFKKKELEFLIYGTSTMYVPDWLIDQQKTTVKTKNLMYELIV